MSFKNRKPRATKERVNGAIVFVEIAQMCISILRNIVTDDVVSMSVKNKKEELAVGKEYLNDLLEWELDKISPKKS